ncbi:MAG: pyridoxal phosphate-dependent aminotransferase [Phycisphaerales bacterium]|nr:pyridoxal phosphate-dependent aminotransferase [Phycisphaerales bacterium]
MMQLSDRVLNLPQSATLAVASRAKAMRRDGLDVLSFAAGEPDFDTPAVIKRAAIAALEAGMTKYAPTPGDPEAREAVAAKLRDENGIPDVTANHIVISTGGKHGLYLAYQCLLDPGKNQQVILPTPAWVSYRPQIELAGGEVVEIPTTVESHFKITPDQLRGALNEHTRVFTINSPSNPCGTMYSPDELGALAQVVVEHNRSGGDVCVLSDEIYEYITFGETPFASFAACHPDVAQYTITANGLSKGYAMTGWRIGYIAAPSGEAGIAVAKAIAKLQAQTTTCICAFTYPAICAALTEASNDVENMRLQFGERARLAFKLVSEIPGFICPEPTGAFYLFPDVASHFGKTSAQGQSIGSAIDFAEALLVEKQVAVVPGDDFGGCGPNHIRISFACGPEQITTGMARVREFVDTLT